MKQEVIEHIRESLQDLIDEAIQCCEDQIAFEIETKNHAFSGDLFDGHHEIDLGFEDERDHHRLANLIDCIDWASYKLDWTNPEDPEDPADWRYDE